MTYEKILHVAFEAIAQQGYEKTSISQIAAAVGVSKPALYYYFRSKDELFTVLYKTIVDRIVSGYEQQLQGWTKETFAARLEAIGIDELRTLRENGPLALALKQFLLVGIRVATIGTETERLRRETEKFYTKVVQYGVQFHFIAAAEAEESAKVLYLMNESLTAQAIDNNDATLEQIWRFFIKKLLIR